MRVLAFVEKWLAETDLSTGRGTRGFEDWRQKVKSADEVPEAETISDRLSLDFDVLVSVAKGDRTAEEGRAYCDERTLKGGLVGLVSLGHLLRINRKQREEAVLEADLTPVADTLRGNPVWTVADVLAVRDGEQPPDGAKQPGFLGGQIVDNEQLAEVTGRTINSIRQAVNKGKIHGDGRAGVDWWW